MGLRERQQKLPNWININRFYLGAVVRNLVSYEKNNSDTISLWFLPNHFCTLSKLYMIQQQKTMLLQSTQFFPFLLFYMQVDGESRGTNLGPLHFVVSKTVIVLSASDPLCYVQVA